ncbi:hypothetical protein K0M31_000494 [Melipona bicolor]|uniref:Uncharacterized protein n=1 Tax=Melipona bicolor TaxID=60889 RepID=A0AA40GDY0_9HYME|nr:hypothetical protein K0M31_000494 [Melipona bicolor]
MNCENINLRGIWLHGGLSNHEEKRTFRAQIALREGWKGRDGGQRIAEIGHSRHDPENKAYVLEIRSKGAVRKFLTCPDIKFSSFSSGYTSRYPRGRPVLGSRPIVTSSHPNRDKVSGYERVPEPLNVLRSYSGCHSPLPGDAKRQVTPVST